MPFSNHIASKYLRRQTLASLVALGGLLAAACSSSENAPGGSAGGAGAATSAGMGPSAGAAGTASGGSAGASGSTGTSGIAGVGQAGSTSGAGGSGTAGGGAGGAGGSGGTASGGTSAGGAGGAAPFALTSSAFKEGDEIPLMYKCMNVNPKGQNISPPLSWGPGPAGTKSYAVVLMHLPSPEHWVIWDIPANVTSLPENIEHVAQPAVPAGSKQSLANLDGFSGSGYLGPCPQAPNSRQSYKFTLYALDVDTLPGVTATSTPGEAATAVKAHLVAGSQGVSLTGTQIQIP